ncbi:hypothetical protein GE09DRAFT_639372 [Coniochaeta sp. 2T2.1]|nr:hypothetical protein GE09DRAFT_639372 [Coniochaeta sp. 2T2.1]
MTSASICLQVLWSRLFLPTYPLGFHITTKRQWFSGKIHRCHQRVSTALRFSMGPAFDSRLAHSRLSCLFSFFLFRASGLVVKSIVAIDGPRVRFAAGAALDKGCGSCLFFGGIRFCPFCDASAEIVGRKSHRQHMPHETASCRLGRVVHKRKT